MGIQGMAPSYDHSRLNMEAVMVSPSFGLYGHGVGYGASCVASPAPRRQSQQGMATQPQDTR